MTGMLALLLALFAAPETAPAPTPCPESAGPAHVDVKAGTRLRAEPDAAAPSVAVVDVDVALAVSARCGAYAEVRWNGLRGWVRKDDTRGPDLERPARTADAARIARARNAMRPLGREGLLGPWRLLTDAATGELTGLDEVATHLAEAYTARTGLAAAPGPAQAVVIFASDTRYRAFAEADAGPSFGRRGHAGGGLAAFALGRNPLETRVLLVHELTHLLSRNALGESVPVWLDEGLADDLAWCRVDTAGRLQPDTFDVFESSRAGAVERSGPRVTADAWTQSARAGRLLPLAALLAPGTRLFSDPGTRRDATTTGAMLVRWCLSDPARAARFREFLRAVSLGGAGDAPALAAALGLAPPEMQGAFSAWGRVEHAGP